MISRRELGSALSTLLLTACLSGSNEGGPPSSSDPGNPNAGNDGAESPPGDDETESSPGDDETEGSPGDDGASSSTQPVHSECASDDDCDDGLECTEDTCETELVFLPDRYDQVTRCRYRATDQGCPVGTFCLAHRGCVETRACAEDDECADEDGCTVGEYCDSSSRTCRHRLLDGDDDREPPLICGGRDCDDAAAFIGPGMPEACNYEDDDCDGEVDEGIDLQTDALHCGGCRFACESGECVGGECATCGALGEQCCLADICHEGACTDGRCTERTCGQPATPPAAPPCSEELGACIAQCDDHSCVLLECNLSVADNECWDCAVNADEVICAENGCAHEANALRCCMQDKCPEQAFQYSVGGCDGCFELAEAYDSCRRLLGCDRNVILEQCFPGIPQDASSSPTIVPQQPMAAATSGEPAPSASDGAALPLPPMPTDCADGCDEGWYCSGSQCVAACIDIECGTDNGVDCGTCPVGLSCSAGRCVDPSDGGSIGASCESDADCASDLECITSDQFVLWLGYIAAGVCTRPCTEDAGCAPNYCVVPENGTAYCLEACESETSYAGKCHDRPDMACGPSNVCVPTCRNDADCDGRFCDLYSGFCQDQPVVSTGVIGGACDPAEPASCPGYCRQGLCTGRCALGGPACGSENWPVSGGDEACVVRSSYHLGDEGMCAMACFTSDDCLDPTHACAAHLYPEEEALLGFPGICWDAAQLGPEEILE